MMFGGNQAGGISKIKVYGYFFMHLRFLLPIFLLLKVE